MVGSSIFWILWYSGMALRNKRDNPDDKFEVYQGLYEVGGWCTYKIKRPPPEFLTSVMNLPERLTGESNNFSLGLYQAPDKIPEDVDIEEVFQKEIAIFHIYYLAECHFQEGPRKSDIGLVLIFKDLASYKTSFKVITYLNPKKGETTLGTYFSYLTDSAGMMADLDCFKTSIDPSIELAELGGPKMPQFFERRYIIDALNYWCDYYQYEYTLEIGWLRVAKEMKLASTASGFPNQGTLFFGDIEVSDDDINNNTIFNYFTFETTILSGTINRPVEWIGQSIRYAGVDYRVIFYKYRYTKNSGFTCSFIATTGYPQDLQKFSPIPREVYKKIVPDEVADKIIIREVSPFFWGQIKEDIGTIVDDDKSDDSNEKINVYYETAGMNVRDPEKYKPSDIVIPAYKASPFAAPGAGVQYPEPTNAVGIFGGDSPHLSVCLGQIFQKGFKPVRNSKYDYRLTMLDGSTFYFDDVNKIWKLIGNKYVQIGATSDGKLDYKTIPEIPETCNIEFDGANKKITLQTDTLSILIDKGNSKIELSDGTRKLTLDSDKAELVNGTKKATLGSSTIEITDGTRKLTIDSNKAEISNGTKKVTLGSSTTEMTDGTRKITMNGSTVDVT